MKTKLTLAFFSLFIILSVALAQAEQTTVSTETPENELTGNPSNIPEGCGSKGFSFQNGQLILGIKNGSFNQQVYFIHNHSDYEQLLLSHPTHTAMSSGWDSRLAQGQWSAIAMNQSNFVINCFGRKPGTIGYVDCKSVLEVCSYPKANTSGGSYWLSENKSLLDTISSLKTRNVTLSK